MIILENIFFSQIIIIPSSHSTIYPPRTCRDQCIREHGRSFDGQCPEPGSCSWYCAATRFELYNGDCEDGRVYHCGRNYTFWYMKSQDPSYRGSYPFMEGCAHAKLCPKGIKLKLFTFRFYIFMLLFYVIRKFEFFFVYYIHI